MMVAGISANALAGHYTTNFTADQERMRVEGQAEKTYTLKLETTQHKLYCQAPIALQFTQRNTIARVRGTIENDDCGASSGTYTIAVRYKDEAGEVHNVEQAEEHWQRDDDQPFSFEHEYLIGENVDLIRVRVRKIECVCAEMPAGNESETNQGENE
jgi:hypothetical protein